jgi:hypothetical protein
MRFLIIVALALCAFSSQVQAGCTCQCVNGQMQPSLDIAPPCMGKCGPVAPSIAPATGHDVLPPGPDLR